jgi:hypothetical protein
MDKIIFVDFQTKICSAWLNAVSDTVWDALGEAKTPSEARQFIGAVEEAPNDGKSYLRASLGWLEAATALSHNQLGGRSVSDAHPTSSITGLDTALAGKAPIVHTHVAADIVGGFTAGQVSFVPGGTIVSSDVQNAINELDADTQLSLGQKQNAATAVQKDSATGAAILPNGTTAQRPSSTVEGQFRYNSQLDVFEGYSNGAWGQVGGGQMYGQAAIKAVFFNNTNIAEDITIKAGTNGGTFGPITIDNGFAVTVESGSTWTVA